MASVATISRAFGSHAGRAAMVISVLTPIALEVAGNVAALRETRRPHREPAAPEGHGPSPSLKTESGARAKSVTLEAGTAGVTYNEVLIPYLVGAPTVTITDPYLLRPHQLRNLGELLDALGRANAGTPTKVHVVTTEDDGDADRACEQFEMLLDVKRAAALDGIAVSFEFASTNHDRWIATDSWEINLGKGLDFWRRPEYGHAGFAARRQEFREIAKTFKVTYVPIG